MDISDRPVAEPLATSTHLDKLRQWLLERQTTVSDIDFDCDLIETRAIDSLQFVEFLLVLEELCGREISMADVTVDSFRTLRLIERNFFAT